MPPILLLLSREVTVRIGILDSRLFPPPAEIFHVMVSMIAGGALFDHLFISLQRIVLGPASLPSIFTGLRLSLGVSLLIIVAAEFVAADKGLGFLIWISWSTLSVGKMYVDLVVIGLLGILFTNGLERRGRLLIPWSQEIQLWTK